MNKETDQQQEKENLSIEQKEKKARGEDIEPQRQVDKPTWSATPFISPRSPQARLGRNTRRQRKK